MKEEFIFNELIEILGWEEFSLMLKNTLKKDYDKMFKKYGNEFLVEINLFSCKSIDKGDKRFNELQKKLKQRIEGK